MKFDSVSRHPLYKTLCCHRPFDGLTELHFASLLSSARREEVVGGTVVIHEGALDNDYLVLLSGELEIRRCYGQMTWMTWKWPSCCKMQRMPA